MWRRGRDGVRDGGRRRPVTWLLVGSLVSGVALPATAQASYTVFEAHAGRKRTAEQPTQRRGPNTVVTLEVRDSTIKYVVNTLTRQAGLQPNYYNSVVLSQRITLHVVNMRVMDAIGEALRGTGLEAKLLSDGVTVSVHPRQGGSADREYAGGVIVGQVTDSTTGAGLNGAQVRVGGVAKLAAVTADSGRFTLRNVPPGDQLLQVRLFGYRRAMRTVTVVDGERTTVRIAMVAVPTVLSGVVTTATGLQRKVEVGNDITTLNVDSIMRVAPITSVTDLLETRVPGLTVLHSDGVPGDPSRIRIRGASSILGNNDPIIVVDGVRVYGSQSDTRNGNLAPGGFVNGRKFAAPSPLDQIDPSSIETIEVFKGPSASALYGSDAAAGVIVITTKHGRAGPTHWNLSVGTGMNYTAGAWPVNYYRFGADSTYSVNIQSKAPFCLWNDPYCRIDSVVAFQALNKAQYSPFSHGHDQTGTLSISGGVPTLHYSVSGSVAGNVGLLKLPGVEIQRYDKFYGPIPSYLLRPDNYQTWGVNGQLAAQPSAALRVTLTNSLFNSNQQQGSLEGAIAQLEGEYIDPTTLDDTPLISQDVQKVTDHQLTSTNAITIGWQPYPWLPLTATGGINTMQRTDESLIPFGINFDGPGSPVSDTTGKYGLGTGTSQNNTLSVGTAIPTLRNHVTIGFGGNVTSQSTADATQFVGQLSPGVTKPTGCLNQFQITDECNFSQSTSGFSTYGWYLEPRLNIASRFFAAPGFRLDGGSASGTQISTHSGGLNFPGLTGFPKMDLSYLVVDQSHPRGPVTLLRPRLAFGVAGTQPGPQERLRLFNAGGDCGNDVNAIAQNCISGTNSTLVSLDGGGTLLPKVALSTLGNTQLRPETSRELEGGVDAELWHGRFSLLWTHYNKTRYDAILGIPVAPSVMAGPTGLNSGQNFQVLKNIGVIRNTGTEMTMNVQIFESRAVSWTVGGNLSNNNNLVVRLNAGQPTVVIGNTRIEAGFPLFGRWETPIVGFVDANHDGVIESNEVILADSAVYVGQQEPKYQLNINSGLTLLNGRLSVNATFAYQNGMSQFNDGLQSSGGFALLPNAPGATLATQALLAAATPNAENQRTDIGLIQTVNTFRFNDLSINLTLPKSVSSWFRVPTASVALQGSNLGIHTNYRGKDPDVNGAFIAAGGDQLIDSGQIPEPRVWWLRLTLGN